MVKTIWQNKEEFMKTTALIMAGGKGERFWPKSRVNMPKQFLSLTDDGKTMIQLTVERISPLVDIKDVYVATNKNYRELVKQQLPGIPEENILCEPVGRNTAPCVGLGAVHVASKYDDAVMIVLPSDHLIIMRCLQIHLKKLFRLQKRGLTL
jgi:mannose-1-phosphate guanylyltransferase